MSPGGPLSDYRGSCIGFVACQCSREVLGTVEKFKAQRPCAIGQDKCERHGEHWSVVGAPARRRLIDYRITSGPEGIRRGTAHRLAAFRGGERLGESRQLDFGEIPPARALRILFDAAARVRIEWPDCRLLEPKPLSSASQRNTGCACGAVPSTTRLLSLTVMSPAEPIVYKLWVTGSRAGNHMAITGRETAGNARQDQATETPVNSPFIARQEWWGKPWQRRRSNF